MPKIAKPDQAVVDFQLAFTSLMKDASDAIKNSQVQHDFSKRLDSIIESNRKIQEVISQINAAGAGKIIPKNLDLTLAKEGLERLTKAYDSTIASLNKENDLVKQQQILKKLGKTVENVANQNENRSTPNLKK